MSTRNFQVDSTGLGGEAVELVVFAFLDFVGSPCFWHSGVGYINWGGEDWLGLGQFAHIEQIPEVIGLTPARTKLALLPVAGELLDEALNEATWGRLCELYLGVVEDSALKATPDLILRGTMGPPEVALSAKGSISVMVEDIRSKLGRINGLRATTQDHQSDVGTQDSFYALLPQMQDYKFVFNGRNAGVTTQGGQGTPGGAPDQNWDYSHWGTGP